MKIGNSRILIETDEEIPSLSSEETSEQPLKGVPQGMTPVGATDGIVAKFEDVQDLIKICCASLFETIKEINEPDAIGLEFGIKLVGEAGVPMVSKASGEANFKISLEWKKTGK